MSYQHLAVTFQVTELSETTRGSNGFGSTGVELKNSSEVISCVNVGYKRLKVSFTRDEMVMLPSRIALADLKLLRPRSSEGWDFRSSFGAW